MKNQVKYLSKSIYLIGAGGHAFSCADVALSCGYKIKGIFGLKEDLGKSILGYTVKATQYELSQTIKKDDNLLIAVGHTYDKNERLDVFNLFENKCIFPKIISPFSIISKYAEVNSGCIVMPGAKVGVDCKIGSHSILNTNSSIDHNSNIGSFSHISTSVTINGNVNVGSNVFIGSGSVLKDSIKVSDNQSFKMCSKITKNK